ncbi:MAG: anthranilate synthase component I [Deltaproteobacteria bacterium]
MKKLCYFPSLEDFKTLAGSYNTIPVYRDILGDLETPVSAFLKIDSGGDAFLLESVDGGETQGRYSIIGIRPGMIVRSRDGITEVIESGVAKETKLSPLDALKQIMDGFKTAHMDGLPKFYGGAIGYIGYDMVRHFERLPDVAPTDLDTYDMFFMFPETLMVFDNVEHKIKIITNVRIDKDTDAEHAYADAAKDIDSIVDRLRKSNIAQNRTPAPAEALKIESNFSKKDFLCAVERTKKYIEQGDIIQAVLSQRFSTGLKTPAFDVYRALRVINPSPYMFFLRLGDTTLAGSSPEILVRVEEGEVTVRPIAGTRRRGRTLEEDLVLEKELLADPKERAEHIMLVDLGRNDVGRVSESGTVSVDELMSVERYSHVMHIVSNVKGRLKANLSPYDAFRACFPAGTLTGAPKIRAMEIIEELEPCRRGIYGGSVGYFGFNGVMDFCIAIRTLVIKDGRIYIQAGAGIVADSVPEREYEETENKARAMLKAVEMALKGLD